MELELTRKQFRRLLDMAYIGNWILNSTRGEDRFKDYDEVESLLFGKAAEFTFGKDDSVSIDDLVNGVAAFVRPHEAQA